MKYIILIMLLGGCSSEKLVFVPSNIKLPEYLLTPTASPIIPELDGITDNDVAVLLQQDEEALAACNSDKNQINLILNPRL